ncbi:hypothetical protein L596_007676 [Steinernema carpocapsae]|uniref:Uncharacterized protein n=1 Tax=Steinernema carpocapsae TaxID=34508 RepID=A0A4U5PA54_STECR|nr:hypothetical protein L596_007676 [Steinernema carpocapsae]
MRDGYRAHLSVKVAIMTPCSWAAAAMGAVEDPLPFCHMLDWVFGFDFELSRTVPFLHLDSKTVLFLAFLHDSLHVFRLIQQFPKLNFPETALNNHPTLFTHRALWKRSMERDILEKLRALIFTQTFICSSGMQHFIPS